MDYNSSATGTLLDCALRQQFPHDIKNMCIRARGELDKFVSENTISKDGQALINQLKKEFLHAASNNQIRSAKSHAERLAPEIKTLFAASAQPNHHHQQQQQRQQQQQLLPQQQQQPGMDKEYQLQQKSKEASYALRRNNPDITDLSDDNRPTKLGERFSELYDNEWTDAFDALSQEKKSEVEIIRELLQLVEFAYRFCRQEADKQLRDLTKAFLQTTTDRETCDEKTDSMIRHHLSEMRKEIAGQSLNMIKKEFKGPIQNSQPETRKVVDVYKSRALELCWYMSIQEVPVYMVPTSSTPFNPDLYRAYTRKGKQPEYFVWPALRLHEKGGILSRGVVQYK